VSNQDSRVGAGQQNQAIQRAERIQRQQELYEDWKSKQPGAGIISELERILVQPPEAFPENWIMLMQCTDGPALLAQELPKHFRILSDDEESLDRKVWNLIGVYYMQRREYWGALGIWFSLYQHLLACQEGKQKRYHKGQPLIRISDCFAALDCPWHAKRFLMLTLCEDAVKNEGTPEPGTRGRLAWLHGMGLPEIMSYAARVPDISNEDPDLCRYPEWLLQRLGNETDHGWATESPSAREAGLYYQNRRYLDYLIRNLGDGTGGTLEMLAEYVLQCVPGCRTMRHKYTPSTDHDVVGSVDGAGLDFRSELGRYFLCECKDWTADPADFSTIAKICRVLDSVKARFGILFSKKGLSGEGKNRYASREQLKAFQDRGIVIVVVEEKDLKAVAQGASFTTMLRRKYEHVRLDLNPEK
jgi:hypothetical protein